MKNKFGIEKILQIAPANPGWNALMKESGEEDPIAFWALVEMEDGSTEVHGYLGGEFMESAEVYANFTAYVGPRGE